MVGRFVNRFGVHQVIAQAEGSSSICRWKPLLMGLECYLGGVFDIESLVGKLLQQLARKQAIYFNVFDTTNISNPISMYGTNVSNTGLHHVSTLNFGDPSRKHEMRCRGALQPANHLLQFLPDFSQYLRLSSSHNYQQELQPLPASHPFQQIKLLRLLRHPDIVEIKRIMLPSSRWEFKDIYVVFELMESDLHQVIKANDDLTHEHHRFFL
ncbi:hypothetical protein L6452_27329 [Arctium lappa]|uniref:Uncharacterized protein n=1 Tax=Arctium lappa TaxID=4217 RepID=A0ACB8ZXH7_ARCLA|nr:hypothetical protein L6452_27329 [Arctium lappa]